MNVKDVLEKQETKELECKVLGHIRGNVFKCKDYETSIMYLHYTCILCGETVLEKRKLNER